MVFVGILSNTCHAPTTFSDNGIDGRTVGLRRTLLRHRGHAQHPAQRRGAFDERLCAARRKEKALQVVAVATQEPPVLPGASGGCA
jgi:hypothetical protein